MNDRFVHGSRQHLFIIILTVLLGAYSIWYARKNDNKKSPVTIGKWMAWILIINSLVYVGYRIQSGYWELRYDLPMEFCNWSMLVTVIALFTQNRLYAELSYFWVLTGSVHGIITPDLQVSFPHIYFFIFFIAHSGLVIASLYSVFGLKLYPGRKSVFRAILMTQVYVIAAFTVDKLLGGNYGYMIEKPQFGSVLDYFGPWPFYIFVIQLIGSVFFFILYIPFYFQNKAIESGLEPLHAVKDSQFKSS